MTETASPPNPAEEARQFLTANASAVLSTANAEGEPNASYAPFVRANDNAFYIYVSQLAVHTGNLLATGRVSLLLLEDEAKTSQLFARRRLTFQCTASPIARDTPPWHALLDAFEAKFGSVMGMLRPLEDFVLFRLQPVAGTYVRGFAQAYRFSGPDLAAFEHINDVGHQRAPGA